MVSKKAQDHIRDYNWGHLDNRSQNIVFQEADRRHGFDLALTLRGSVPQQLYTVLTYHSSYITPWFTCEFR